MLNSSINDELYKQKYLKYKFKYLELKEIVGGKPKSKSKPNILEKYQDLANFCEHLKQEILYFNDQFKGNELFNYLKGSITFNSLDRQKFYELLIELNKKYSDDQKSKKQAYSRNCTKEKHSDNHLQDSDFPSTTKEIWFSALITGFRNINPDDLDIEFDDFSFSNNFVKNRNTEKYFVEKLVAPTKENILHFNCKKFNESREFSFIVFADSIETAKEQIIFQHRLNKLIRYIDIIYNDLRFYVKGVEDIPEIQKLVLKNLKELAIEHTKKT